MSFDLEGLVRLAIANVAVRIEKVAGPTNAADEQAHVQRLKDLEGNAIVAKLSLQDRDDQQ